MDDKELFGEMKEPETKEPQEMVFREDEDVQEQDLTSEQIQQMVQEKAEKGNRSFVVAVATILFVLIIGLCVYIAVSISHMLPEGSGQDKEYEAQTEDPWEEILGEGYNEEQPEEAAEEQQEKSEIEYSDSNTSDVYTYPNYAKETFDGLYYDDIVDCIDDSVSYDIKRKYCDVKEPENNVDIHTSYICLEGDIPGIDEINEVLKENATYFVENYRDGKDEMQTTLDGKYRLDATIRSFVTYNTENLISVVIREDISISGLVIDVRLKCYNINLDTGIILDNASVLELRDDFGQEFRERCNRQNGAGSADIFSDSEMIHLLTNNDSAIFFYTPMGAELGYNYEQDGYQGWITITMKDYEKYLRSL